MTDTAAQKALDVNAFIDWARDLEPGTVFLPNEICEAIQSCAAQLEALRQQRAKAGRKRLPEKSLKPRSVASRKYRAKKKGKENG